MSRTERLMVWLDHREATLVRLRPLLWLLSLFNVVACIVLFARDEDWVWLAVAVCQTLNALICFTRKAKRAPNE